MLYLMSYIRPYIPYLVRVSVLGGWLNTTITLMLSPLPCCTSTICLIVSGTVWQSHLMIHAVLLFQIEHWFLFTEFVLYAQLKVGMIIMPWLCRRNSCFEISSVSLNPISWFMAISCMLFCFRLFCSPSSVASIGEVIDSAIRTICCLFPLRSPCGVYR